MSEPRKWLPEGVTVNVAQTAIGTEIHAQFTFHAVRTLEAADEEKLEESVRQTVGFLLREVRRVTKAPGG